MKKAITCIWDVALYVIMFFLLQTIVLLSLNVFGYETNGTTLAITQVISGLLTIALFSVVRWAPISVLTPRPAKELSWVAIMSAALLIPAAWFDEMLGIEMSDEMVEILTNVMSGPVGFVAVGIIAPFAEEFVFRGAILRRCLAYFNEKQYDNDSPLSRNGHWIAIAISALLFALVHGNMAQGIHAFIIGLLLGWLYYSTSSIWPGIILHLVNNSLAALQMNLTDMDPDATLSEMFGGNNTLMYISILISTIIAVCSLRVVTKAIGRHNTQNP